MPGAKVMATDIDSFTVEGIEPARTKDARTTLRDFFRSTEWNMSETATGFSIKLTDPYKRVLKDQTVQESIRTLERRVNVLGVAEPVITPHGSAGNQILVQLPGVTDVVRAKDMIKRTAQLSLKLVENEAATREMLLPAGQTEPPPTMEIVSGAGAEPGSRAFYLVRKEAVITGRDLKNARPSVSGETGLPDIQFSLTPTGAQKFGQATGENVGRRLAVILDGTVESAPGHQQPDHRSGRHPGYVLPGGGGHPRQGPARGRSSRDPEVPAGTDGGRVARQGLDPVRGHGLGGGNGLHHPLHAPLLPHVRGERGGGPPRQPAHPSRRHGLRRAPP